MRCNGLPNANDPSDLRKYIHMWQDDVSSLNRREINWLLKTNEQSILTQDQTVVDLSRANLKKLQPEVGEMFAKRGTEVLGILGEMDAVIRDRYSLSPSKMEDLLDVSTQMRFESEEIYSCVPLSAEAGDPNRPGLVHRRVYVQNIEQHRAQHDPKWINPSDVQV